MLDKAMTRLTGKNTLSDAWKEFFVPEDVVGLKVNGNSLSALRNTDYIDHYPALTSAITDGLESIGIRSGNIVIYERSEEELAYARLTPQKETDAVRVLGTRAARRSSGGIGYSKQSWPVGEDASHVTRIVTDICTALINIPVLKDHRLSGITGCMKNHYGSIDNPRTFHGNSCTGPGIAEVNAIPVIREKQRLIIANALFCVYDGGPRWSPNRFWPHGRILVGTDPVAMDTVLLHILDTKRQSEGLSPVASRSLHLAEAEKLGLGVSAMERIDLIDLELG
jgi:uncharacterized protein (DUF362 family)